MKLNKTHRKVEKTINRIVFWDSNLTGYFNNEQGNKSYVKLTYNDDNSKIKVEMQDFDISNIPYTIYLEV